MAVGPTHARRSSEATLALEACCWGRRSLSGQSEGNGIFFSGTWNLTETKQREIEP